MIVNQLGDTGVSMVKFIVDEMLGNIVRWLRILGFDTLAASSLRQRDGEDIDTKILFKALDEGRVLVTADVNLVSRAERLGIKVIAVDAREREVCSVLRGILKTLNIFDEAREHLMSRCPVCNGVLRKASRSEVEGKVPTGVWERVHGFWVCTKCGKVYWIGSHFRGIRKTLSCIFSGD